MSKQKTNETLEKELEKIIPFRKNYAANDLSQLFNNTRHLIREFLILNNRRMEPLESEGLEENPFFTHCLYNLEKYKILTAALLNAGININYFKNGLKPTNVTDNKETQALINYVNQISKILEDSNKPPKKGDRKSPDSSLESIRKVIHNAITKGHMVFLRSVLISSIDNENNTLAHVAIRNNDTGLIKLLIDLDGINYAARNNNGETVTNIMENFMQEKKHGSHEGEDDGFELIKTIKNSTAYREFIYLTREDKKEKEDKGSDENPGTKPLSQSAGKLKEQEMQSLNITS